MTPPCSNEFASTAKEFCELAEKDAGVSDADLWKIRGLLLRLMYHIPAVEMAHHGFDFDGARPDEAQYSQVTKRFSGFSFSTYRVVFDPHDFNATDEPVVGLLSDDLADIYRDLSQGLDSLEKGHLAEACWEWSFSYRSHWARHAVSALAAIELYRTDNYIGIE